MKRKLTMCETQITVVGNRRSQFPVDMLRYDSCVPATETDANTIRRTIEDTIGNGEPQILTISLRRFSSGGSPANQGRWQSFGWEVRTDTGRPDW